MINKERECFGMINCVYMAVYLAHIPKHPERERERGKTQGSSLYTDNWRWSSTERGMRQDTTVAHVVLVWPSHRVQTESEEPDGHAATTAERASGRR
jgi:hypothetical protein